MPAFFVSPLSSIGMSISVNAQVKFLQILQVRPFLVV